MKLLYKVSALMLTPGRVGTSHVHRTFEDVLAFNAFLKEIENCGECVEYNHFMVIAADEKDDR